MSRARRAATLMTAAALLSAAAACTNGGSTRSTATSTAPVPPGSPTTTLPATPEDVAAQQVLALLPRYFRAIDELYNDPKKSLNDIYQVETDPAAGQDTRAITAERLAGITSSGYTKLISSKVTSVDLTNKPNAKPRILPTVKVTTCVDVTGVKAVDKNGKSAVPASRKPYLISQLTISNYRYPDPTAWVVSQAPNTGASTCSA